MSFDNHEASPPAFGRLPQIRGFLPLNPEDASPMVTHGSGTLTSLIKTRSSSSLFNMNRRPSSFRGRDLPDEEDPVDFENGRRGSDERRMSVLNGPQMRSQRLIGNSNPRYRWERYWKTEEQLKLMKKPLRAYYERTNSLIQQYIFIDRLLDSSLPHDLLNEYTNSGPGLAVPPTISEENHTPSEAGSSGQRINGFEQSTKKVKRTPRDIYRLSGETTALLSPDDEDGDTYDGPKPEIPGFEDDSVESGDQVVQIAIYINLAANAVLLAAKIAVIVLTNSLSVLASLVDAALDFLSTGIVFTTAKLIEIKDDYSYPVGRRRLEPIGVLVFSIIMVTSFFQVALGN